MVETMEKMDEAYRNADFTGRLHLYLQFPEFRNGFLAIDRGERATAAGNGMMGSGRSGRRQGNIFQTLSRSIGPPCG